VLDESGRGESRGDPMRETQNPLQSKKGKKGKSKGKGGGPDFEPDFDAYEEQAERAYLLSPSFVALAIRCRDVCFKEGLTTWQEYGAVSQCIRGESARERGEFLLQLADDRRKGENTEPVDYVDSHGCTRLDMSKGRIWSNGRANTPST